VSNVLQTEMDFTLVKQYILLPILLDVLERDINAINVAPLKMTIVYIKMLQQAQEHVHDDLVRVRKQMRSHGLKVYEENKTKLSVDAQYTCRGYHHSFSMLWSLVKSELETLLSGYLGVDLDA